MTSGTYICPHPDCDSQTFRQKVTQFETVTVDSKGEPLEFAADTVEVRTIACGECETPIKTE